MISVILNPPKQFREQFSFTCINGYSLCIKRDITWDINNVMWYYVTCKRRHGVLHSVWTWEHEKLSWPRVKEIIPLSFSLSLWRMCPKTLHTKPLEKKPNYRLNSPSTALIKHRANWKYCWKWKTNPWRDPIGNYFK